MDISATELKGTIYFESKHDNIYDNRQQLNACFDKLKHIDITGNVYISNVSSSWKIKNGWQMTAKIELDILPLIELEDYYKLNYDYPVTNPDYDINDNNIATFLPKFILIHFTTSDIVPFYIEGFNMNGQAELIEDTYIFGENLGKREFMTLANQLRSNKFLSYVDTVYDKDEFAWDDLNTFIKQHSVNLAQFSKRKTGTSIVGEDRSIFVFNN